MAVLARGLCCHMSPLVLCANKTPSCCGAGVLRSSAESGFPISTAQSNAHIPRPRQDSPLQSLMFIHPCMQKKECGILSISAPSPCRVVPSQKCALSTLFSGLFRGLVLLTHQRVPKPVGGVLKQGATRSVSSLWHLTHALFFCFFLRSCISHSQKDKTS